MKITILLPYIFGHLGLILSQITVHAEFSYHAHSPCYHLLWVSQLLSLFMNMTVKVFAGINVSAC